MKKKEKLFKTLVIGGAFLVLNSPANAQEIQESNLTLCNPENEKHCIENEDGDLVPKEGMVCCWGTSCELPKTTMQDLSV